MVVGRTMAEHDLLSGQALGVLVADHEEGMEALLEGARILRSDARHAQAVLDGLEHYHFLEEIQLPPIVSEAASGGSGEENP